LEDILITVSNLEFIAEIEEESTRLCWKKIKHIRT
jgi:hypothetical protein